MSDFGKQIEFVVEVCEHVARVLIVTGMVLFAVAGIGTVALAIARVFGIGD